jgi:hypothetical protein
MQSIDYTTSSSPRAADDAAVRRQQILAISILAVLLLGGVAFGWWRWQSTRTPDEPLVDVGGGPGAWMQRPMMQQPPPDGVRKVGSSYRLKTGDATMYVSQTKAGGWQYNFSYQPNRAMNGVDAAILLARYNSQALELTKDQIDRLEKLGPFSSGMVVSDPDRAKIAALWETYAKASGGAQAQAENALKSTLADIANRSVEPTKAAIQDRVAKIREILTPEQVQKLSTPSGARGRRPAGQ